MDEIEEKANVLTKKIKHYLICTTGKVLSEATIEEFYQAFCHSLREEIMINWTATLATMQKNQARTAYYLSMEYLPGRRMDNNITNIGQHEIVQRVLEKTDHNLHDLIISEPDPGLGNGGLGRLASCFMDALAAKRYPAFGYGLRYQYGIFEQEVWNGVQVERPDCWLLNENPWEFRRDSFSTYVHYAGKPIHATNSHGDEVFTLEDFEEVRALPYDTPIIGYPTEKEFSVLTLRLWSTKDSPRNFELQRYNAGRLDQAGENTSLTDVLYPNDHNETGKRIRLKQEFLLVSASLQDIIRRHLHNYEDLKAFPDKARLQLNDTHPALVIPELIRILTKDHDISFQRAWEMTQEVCNYTNHTVLREALEEWNEQRMISLLPRQYRIIQNLNLLFCDAIRSKFPGDDERVRRMSFIEEGQIKMAYLLIYACRHINGVAELHSEILKRQLFKDFYEMYPDKFTNVTNGVTQRRWILHANRELADLITKRIGDRWITHFDEIAKLHEFAKDPETQNLFLEIKRKNKDQLQNFLHHQNPVRDERGRTIQHYQALGHDSLYDVQIKRIHEYKRQLLNLIHTIIVYHELKANPNARKISRMILFGGKAAPGYQNAKHIIQFAHILARVINHDEAVNQKLRIAFIENYNVSRAQIIIPAADLSQQISTAGMEASGTGNMKLSMNGALTIGTDDGANIEMRKSVTDEWWPFSFGCSAEEIGKMKAEQSYDVWDIYSKDEKIRKAVDALRDGSITKDPKESEVLGHLHAALLEGHYAEPADRFFVLKDLNSYYETQKKVEDLFVEPQKWAEFALHNIASMGKFSVDSSIQNYAENIWQLQTCTIDEEVLKTVREEYADGSIS